MSKKDAELAALRLKLDTLSKQQAEREQQVEVLKEQVSTKDKQSEMIMADVSAYLAY